MGKTVLVGKSPAVVYNRDFKGEHFRNHRKRQSDMARPANHKMPRARGRLDENLHLAAAHGLAFPAEILVIDQGRLCGFDGLQTFLLGRFFVPPSTYGSV